MYDFMLGTKEEIQSHEKDFLVAVKRMLPRWLNSIPDSEFISICDLADSQGEKYSNNEKMVFVETGVGASTLALAGTLLNITCKLILGTLHLQKQRSFGRYCRRHFQNILDR